MNSFERILIFCLRTVSAHRYYHVKAGTRYTYVYSFWKLEFQKSLSSLETGSGKIISVISDQGVGKSRIVSEARRSSPKNIRWIEGRAFEYTQKDSYWIARDLLNNLFQVNQGSLIVEPKDKLKAFMSMLDKDKFTDIYPLLAHFLNITIEEKLNIPVLVFPCVSTNSLIVLVLN